MITIKLSEIGNGWLLYLDGVYDGYTFYNMTPPNYFASHGEAMLAATQKTLEFIERVKSENKEKTGKS